jgi:hypothetical protein
MRTENATQKLKTTVRMAKIKPKKRELLRGSGVADGRDNKEVRITDTEIL